MGSLNNSTPPDRIDLSGTYIPASTLLSPWFSTAMEAARRKPLDTFISSQQSASPPSVTQQADSNPVTSVMKSAFKIGSVVAASMLGEILFGYLGAVLIGAGASGLLSAVFQQKEKGHINSKLLALDTALGAIPGGVGSQISKKLFGKKIAETTSHQVVAQGVATGAIDGGLIGYLGGFGESALNSQESKGSVNWKDAFLAGGTSSLAEALTGAALGAFFAHKAKFFFSSFIKTKVPEHLKHLEAPKMTASNRASAVFLQHSDDPVLMNFHKVDDTVYRGAMPHRPEAFAQLKEKHGIDVIIDLRGARTTPEKDIAFEKAYAKEHDMDYVHIPMDTKDRPSEAELSKLFKVIHQAEAEGKKVYLHCKHGIDRTGVMTAAWEIANGKTQKEAYANMKKYGYNTWHQQNKPEPGKFVQAPDVLQAIHDAL